MPMAAGEAVGKLQLPPEGEPEYIDDPYEAALKEKVMRQMAERKRRTASGEAPPSMAAMAQARAESQAQAVVVVKLTKMKAQRAELDAKINALEDQLQTEGGFAQMKTQTEMIEPNDQSMWPDEPPIDQPIEEFHDDE